MEQGLGPSGSHLQFIRSPSLLSSPFNLLLTPPLPIFGDTVRLLILSDQIFTADVPPAGVSCPCLSEEQGQGSHPSLLLASARPAAPAAHCTSHRSILPDTPVKLQTVHTWPSIACRGTSLPRCPLFPWWL